MELENVLKTAGTLIWHMIVTIEGGDSGHGVRMNLRPEA